MGFTERFLPLIIPENRLVHGNYYMGRCRNTSVARWNSETKEFHHWRNKFGWRKETIEYWQVDGHFDGFIPIFDLGPELPPMEIDLGPEPPVDLPERT